MASTHIRVDTDAMTRLQPPSPSDKYDGEDWRASTAELSISADAREIVADGEDTVTVTQAVPSGATGDGALLVADEAFDVPIEDGHAEQITVSDGTLDTLEIAIRADGFTPDGLELDVIQP